MATMDLAYLIAAPGAQDNTSTARDTIGGGRKSGITTAELAHLFPETSKPAAASSKASVAARQSQHTGELNTMELAHLIADRRDTKSPSATTNGSVSEADESEEEAEEEEEEAPELSRLTTMDLARFVAQRPAAAKPKPKPAVAAPVAPVMAAKRPAPTAAAPNAAALPARSTSSQNSHPRMSQDTMDLAHMLVRPAHDPEDGLTTMDLANMIAIRSAPSIAEILNQPAPTPEILRRQPSTRYY